MKKPDFLERHIVDIMTNEDGTTILQKATKVFKDCFKIKGNRVV